MTDSKKTRQLRQALAVALTTSALAPIALAGGSDIWFEPLTESAAVQDANSIAEGSQPWIAPSGVIQYNLFSMRLVEDAIISPEQSVLRVPAGRSSSMFDMLAFDSTGEFLFIPHETPIGAGVSRHDILKRTTTMLFQGDMKGAEGDWSNDYAAFDPARITPNETLFLAEEWSGEGRVIEVMNPFAAPQDIQTRELQSIANVAHEGINFSEKYPNTVYYVDEWNSGAVYKFVMTTAGDYTKGQTFVLKVDAYEGVASDLWNDESNVGSTRTGAATWTPLTNSSGAPLSGITDPFRNGPTNDPRENADTRGGRPAADDVEATPYGRPEDIEVGVLANGNEVVYFCATSERAVYSIESLEGNKANVGVLVSDADTPKNLGKAATTAEMNSPDNLAQDAAGNIYVIEDAPNSSSTGGDIWFVRDVDNDGVAESLDHFLSLRVAGSEATGMIFNPAKPTEFVVAVQHPSSTDLETVPEGLGDAVWQFDISTAGTATYLRDLKQASINKQIKRKISGFFDN